MPVCDRLEYLGKVLLHLENCSNIQNTILIISQDCDIKEIETRINEIKIDFILLKHIRPFLSIPSYFNNEYATSSNVYFLLKFAFDYMKVDGVVLLESDLVPSFDFYDYHLWMFEHFLKNQNNVLTVNSFNFNSRKSSEKYEIRPFEFTVWGWSTSLDNWKKYLKHNWTPFNNWDIHLQKIRILNRMVSLQPSLSRVKNIGQRGINFNVKNEKWKESFDLVYISDEKIDYDGVKPRVVEDDEASICRNAKIC